jgi:chorismate mutase/prephenate dehydratase
MSSKNPAKKLSKAPPPVVACLGPEGTFSHLLALRRFGASARVTTLPDLGAVFDFLHESPGSFAIVPVENSSGGTIYDTVDLLIKHAERLVVHEDLALDVRTGLLGKKGRPVRRVYSHFAPLHHHREWLLKNFPGVALEAVSSTAVAAALAAKTADSAALASPGTAALYGLDILKFPVRPEAVNVTRFYTIGLAPTTLPVEHLRPRSPATLLKTALVVRLKNECGSLYRFLGPFARSAVNLRMIVSRPVAGHPETYVFFVEVEGDPNAPALSRALKNAAKSCDSIRVLGPFPGGGGLVRLSPPRTRSK